MDVNKKREILFRGKTMDGEWLYGFYHNETSIESPASDRKVTRHHIYTQDFDKFVIPETVGQFTGLTDKNGKKIFEGDIVVTRYTNGKICSIGDIKFDCGVFGAEWTVHKKHKTMVGSWGQLHNLRRLDDDIINHIEVIGNIHDNPELLEQNL